jgi:hypothetical protein
MRAFFSPHGLQSAVGTAAWYRQIGRPAKPLEIGPRVRSVDGGHRDALDLAELAARLPAALGEGDELVEPPEDLPPLQGHAGLGHDGSTAAWTKARPGPVGHASMSPSSGAPHHLQGILEGLAAVECTPRLGLDLAPSSNMENAKIPVTIASAGIRKRRVRKRLVRATSRWSNRPTSRRRSRRGTRRTQGAAGRAPRSTRTRPGPSSCSRSWS